MTDKLNKNKILLVVANRIDDLYIKFPVSTTSWIKPRFPLGIGSIGATLEESGWNVSILDNYLEKRSAHEVAQMCVDNKFKYVGINANSLTIEEALNIARYIKDLNNKIIVILGGPHPSLFPERVLSYTFVDFVILGEGEIALKNLLKDLESSSCILKKKIVSAERIANLDRLPFPARHLTNFFSYSRKAEVLEETPADVLYTSRGCPYNCAFCSSSLIWKRTYSKRNGETVVDEIEHLINKYKSKAIIFREDNFTCDKEHIIDICRNIISRKINIPWECESRTDNLSPDIIEYMAKAGCRAMWFGIESGSPKILNQILKGITLSQARNVFKLCKEAGIRTGAAFMLGFPNENIEDIIMTRDFALELNADITYFAVYVGFPFSSLYKYFLNNKLIEFKYRDVLITRNENFSFRQLQIMERKMQSYMNFHKSIRTSLRSPKLFLNGIFKIIRHPGAVRNFFKYFL